MTPAHMVPKEAANRARFDAWWGAIMASDSSEFMLEWWVTRSATHHLVSFALNPTVTDSRKVAKLLAGACLLQQCTCGVREDEGHEIG